MSITIEAVNFAELFINVVRAKGTMYSKVYLTPGWVAGPFFIEFHRELELESGGRVNMYVKIEPIPTDTFDRKRYTVRFNTLDNKFGDAERVDHVFQQGDTVLADDDGEHNGLVRIMQHIMRYMK